MATSLLKNVSWLTFGNVLVRPLWLAFVLVACVRVLGEEGYGVFTTVLFLTAITATFTELGLNQYTIREVARRRAHAARYFSNLFLLKLLLGGAALAAALGVGWALGYDPAKLVAVLLAGLYTVTLALTEYCRAFYRAYERMQYEAVSVVVEKGLVVGLGLVLLFWYRSPVAVLGGMALGMALALALNVGWTTRRLAALRPQLWSRQFVRTVLPAAFPLGLASQFVVIYFRTDTVMVDAMVGEAAAGQYGFAYRLLEAAVLLSGMVMTVVYPRFSTLFHQGQGAAWVRLLRWSALSMITLGLAVAGGLTLLAEPIIALFAGAAFAPAVGALQLLAWGAPFMCINFLLSTVLAAADDQRRLAWVMGAAALANVLLNLVLIPRFSFYGACAATLTTEGCLTVALGLRYFRHTHVQLTSSP